jgi:hypothetical protein
MRTRPYVTSRAAWQSEARRAWGDEGALAQLTLLPAAPYTPVRGRGRHASAHSRNRRTWETLSNRVSRFYAARWTGRTAIWHAVLSGVAVLVTSALLALYLIVQPDVSDVRAELLAQPHRICPVRSCVDYPVPGDVKGITLATLTNYVLFAKAAQAQIRAAKTWGANAVRFQVVQDKLVGQAGHKQSTGYMSAVRHLVDYALKNHLTVIINAQTELTMGFAKNENLPTHATYAFWRYMTHYYGDNPHVVFDLFNEPRFCNWQQWEAAFQPLVNYLRGLGAKNQFWVEGLWWAATLAGVPILQGQGIIYSFHHPGAPWPWMKPVGPGTWDQAFGYLASEHIPVVDGEFVNFMGGYYWPRSTQMVSEYLRYISEHHIGVVAWSLQAGIMTATSKLTSAVSEPQGDGRLMWRYFHGEPLPTGPMRTEKVPFRFARL